MNRGLANLQRDHYRLRVRASDKGEPPSYADVDVELDVVDRNNKPPIWDQSVYGPIFTKENVVVGTKIASVKARLVSKRTATTAYTILYLRDTVRGHEDRGKITLTHFAILRVAGVTVNDDVAAAAEDEITFSVIRVIYLLTSSRDGD